MQQLHPPETSEVLNRRYVELLRARLQAAIGRPVQVPDHLWPWMGDECREQLQGQVGVLVRVGRLSRVQTNYSRLEVAYGDTLVRLNWDMIGNPGTDTTYSYAAFVAVYGEPDVEDDDA